MALLSNAWVATAPSDAGSIAGTPREKEVDSLDPCAPQAARSTDPNRARINRSFFIMAPLLYNAFC
jgi:hypothetical protein